MPAHKDLTGADLHEPKGIAAAAANTVYLANGSGSGAWTSAANVNKQHVLVSIWDLTAASTTLVPFPVAATITRLTGIQTGAISGASTVVTFTRAADSMGTMTVTTDGVEATTYTISNPTNNTMTAGSFLKIVCDGGATGGTFDLNVIIEYTLT